MPGFRHLGFWNFFEKISKISKNFRKKFQNISKQFPQKNPKNAARPDIVGVCPCAVADISCHPAPESFPRRTMEVGGGVSFGASRVHRVRGWAVHLLGVWVEACASSTLEGWGLWQTPQMRRARETSSASGTTDDRGDDGGMGALSGGVGAMGVCPSMRGR